MKPLHLLFFALLFAGCEGATTMTHTFHNRTQDTLDLTALFSELPWYDTVQVSLPPNASTTLYTLDKLGKCHDCGQYGAAAHWVDTLQLNSAVWLTYPTDADWRTEVSEGRTWIQFDHTLNIGPIHVE